MYFYSAERQICKVEIFFIRTKEGFFLLAKQKKGGGFNVSTGKRVFSWRKIMFLCGVAG